MRDNFTRKIPFDNANINHHEYNCSLQSWVTVNEIPKLTKHISESTSIGYNSLWKYYGIQNIAEPYKSEDPEKDTINLLREEILQLRNDIRIQSKSHDAKSKITSYYMIPNELKARYG